MTDNNQKPLSTIISVIAILVSGLSAFFSSQANKLSEESNKIAQKAYELSKESQKEGGVIVGIPTKITVTSEKYHGNSNDKIALTFFIDNQDNKNYSLDESSLIINSLEGGEKTTLKASLILPNNYKQVEYLKSKINKKFSPLAQSTVMNGFKLAKRDSSQITLVYFDQSTSFRIHQHKKGISYVYSAKFLAKINGQEKIKSFCFGIQPNHINETFALKEALVKDCPSSNTAPFPDLPDENFILK